MQYQIFGESHGAVVGVVLTEVPAGIAVVPEEIEAAMARRAPGKVGTSQRHETDKVTILSGVYNGYTEGTPICAIIPNMDARSEDYKVLPGPRPGHADLTNMARTGAFTDLRGGGHTSGRLTAPIVFAGVIAKNILKKEGITVSSSYTTGDIQKAIEEGDSVGGIIECTVSGVRRGIGDPDHPWESELAYAVLAIPGMKGIEFGDGFAMAHGTGSTMNDAIIPDGHGGCTLRTNHSGGINGGISNGMPIVFRVAVRPTPSIAKEQDSVAWDTMQPVKISVKGRHDPCIAVRAAPVVEAVAAIVTVNQYQRAGLIGLFRI